MGLLRRDLKYLSKYLAVLPLVIKIKHLVETFQDAKPEKNFQNFSLGMKETCKIQGGIVICRLSINGIFSWGNYCKTSQKRETFEATGGSAPEG